MSEEQLKFAHCQLVNLVNDNGMEWEVVVYGFSIRSALRFRLIVNVKWKTISGTTSVAFCLYIKQGDAVR